MRKQLQDLLKRRVEQCVSQERTNAGDCPKIERKKESCLKRKAEIVKSKATGKITDIREEHDISVVSYEVHFQYLIKQQDLLILEEEIEQRRAEFLYDELIEDIEVHPNLQRDVKDYFVPTDDSDERLSFEYNRLRAVQYAERWWNEFNPAYKRFENDCTNFISQCLRAGGAPMRGIPNRNRGWWMTNTWSFSWTVAQSLKGYLGTSGVGLRAKEVASPRELLLGDIICYDFQGDGRFDHNTIVTGKDAYGMPLVNAHTTNSRMRYWAYEDSTAYTPQIKYKFYTIVDDR